ncbi:MULTISPECIES: ABC transporter ATP-binding protein [unclassified Gemella]|uniref:ABC transporter ATP-binding protein n=1 Tax=unclassified Gemella TaxID=2624949 RepID=UPI0015D03BA7|nr:MULTISPECIES: ABC transporter ATP-binding protein [unclassified Gemella]MBF0710378.1 ABC transporter ATP-binding protein [Gemella sp. GL1.1]NYS27722.1 ABC transporter ATP-binding protein [Gemella sp. GL1]
MFKLLKRLSKKELALSLFTVIFIFINVWLELEIPSFMSEITNKLGIPGTSSSDIFAFNMDSPGMKMIYYSFLSLMASVTVAFLSTRIAASFTHRLREDIFNRTLDFSDTELKKFGIPSLLTRTTNDITQIQMLITMGLQVVIKGPVMAIWAMSKIYGKHIEWMWVTASAILVLMLMISAIIIFAFPREKIIQKMTDKLNLISRESLTGIRVVRAYNAEKYQEDKFAEVNNDLTNLNLFTGRLYSLFSPVMTAISSGLTLAIYFLGAFIINDIKIPSDPSQIESVMRDRLTVFSDMIVFSSYAMLVVFGFMMMMMVFMILPRALVSARRINEVLDTETSIIFPKTSKEVKTDEPILEFKNVSFRYTKNSEAVLQNISFTAKKGQTIAFIGSTGSGKSTLINLIVRLFDASQGDIMIKGINVKDFSKEDLSKIVAYIPQKAVLFSGNIKDNINMGISNVENMTEEDIWSALELAQAKDFVQTKEEGINSQVSQGGTNFSGGQKQRLAISRALARKSEIIIFDDSFSALDYKTDKTLRSALNANLKDTTKLIVAQRISTIMDADLILVLDEGRIVGMGSHAQLLEDNEVYREIAYSQLSKEELENEK